MTPDRDVEGEDGAARLQGRLDDLKALRHAVLSRASVTATKVQAVDELDRLIADTKANLQRLDVEELKRVAERR